MVWSSSGGRSARWLDPRDRGERDGPPPSTAWAGEVDLTLTHHWPHLQPQGLRSTSSSRGPKSVTALIPRLWPWLTCRRPATYDGMKTGPSVGPRSGSCSRWSGPWMQRLGEWQEGLEVISWDGSYCR